MIFSWTYLNNFRFLGESWQYGGVSASGASVAAAATLVANEYRRLVLMAQ